MRFAHVMPTPSSEPQLVVIVDEGAVVVEELFPGAPRTLNDLIDGGHDILTRIATHLERAEPFSLEGAQYAPAVPEPPLVLAVGLNYSAHSSELGLKTDAAPTVFALWPNSLSGHEGTTAWPRALSEAVDYEAELGVIVGPAGKDLSPETAADHIWGYTVVNDITARDIQFAEAQWSRCKSFDGFTPVGPVVVTADEIPDPQNLRIWTELDGHLLQDATTGQMVRSVTTLMAHLSQSATLQRGTLISTGSPGGAGYSRDPQVFLRDRSTVIVGVEGIGELKTHCRIID